MGYWKYAAGILVLLYLFMLHRLHDHLIGSATRLCYFKSRPSPKSRNEPRTIPSTGLPYSSIAIKMNERRENLKEHCKQKELELKVSERTIRRHLQPNIRHNIIYCGVEKAGSTFWRRLLQLLHEAKVQSPFTIRPDQVLENYEDLVKAKVFDIVAMLQTYKSFIFVRNPYNRLFSGYVDKIYSPNPYYWASIGSEASSYATGGPSSCGHNVTFHEFVNYIVHVEKNFPRKRDPHFIPATHLCIPCHVGYTFIGKVETFEEDTLFILEKLNLSNYIPFLQNFKNQSKIDSIKDKARSFIESRDEAAKCLSYDEALKRLWNSLQIRGLVSDKINFPFKVNEAQIISETQLTSVLIKAVEESAKFDLNKQITKYFQKAYAQIPKQLLREISKVYREDFDIFRYDAYPKNLHIELYSDNNKIVDTFSKVN